MAYITQNSNGFGAFVATTLNTMAAFVAEFFGDIRNASARADFMQELQAMDDATLKATHGITRSQIVSYVFHDKLVP